MCSPGGFSNSDVLGAARGWASIFRYNEQVKKNLDSFLARPDTLSLGVCNGCQLSALLNIPYPEHERAFEMQDNESGKFESSFLSVKIQETRSIMLKPLVGSQLGIWVAHGEGRFKFPLSRESYDIPMTYTSEEYPFNPNGSDYRAAAVSSHDGRHLAIMPHLERSLFSWNWPYRGGEETSNFEISPWILAFISARKWVEDKLR